MADEAQARVGRLVDERYKLVEVMASGSMGAVYKAERVPVGKLVAVKFLHASFANDSEFQARFDRETRVLSKLAHPNCVSVVDFGVWNDEPYLVMDFVAGTTLRQKEDDAGRIAPAQALGYARQIAAGLAHAHAQGIVHRDIKPANIMITDEIGHGERVRILDFGLARLRGNVGRDATQTNMVVGTPNYMAPEQTVPGGTIDARTDIYAVGVVLFEMIAGERPFRAEDTLQLLGMHRAAPIPRLADRVPPEVELPAGLQELIDRAMAKSTKDRYQTAIELAGALDAVAGTSSRVSMPPVVVEVQKKDGGSVAVAPTMLNVDTAEIETKPARAPSHFWRNVFAALVLLGGASAAAAYVITHRGDDDDRPQKSSTIALPAPGSDGFAPPALEPPLPPPPPQQPTVAQAMPDASVSIDAPVVAAIADPNGSGSGAALGSDLAAAGSAGDQGSALAMGSAAPVGSDDIELDPSTAEDLDPAAKTGSAQAAQDEAADAPKTTAEVAQHTAAAVAAAPAQAAAPTIATNLHDAVVLIQNGQRALALASLQPLYQKNPRSAYIPFLLGNLYFDQQWWSVAMDHYADAIKKNPEYRDNPTINRNVIKMLASTKTRNRATNFLRGTIGHPAAAYLKAAAARDPNPVVRKQAGQLARYVR